MEPVITKALTGVTAAEAEDAELIPAAFVAVTVNVYVIPFVSPATIAVVVALVAVNPPGLLVTVYKVMGLKPLLAGAVHDTVARL